MELEAVRLTGNLPLALAAAAAAVALQLLLARRAPFRGLYLFRHPLQHLLPEATPPRRPGSRAAAAMLAAALAATVFAAVARPVLVYTVEAEATGAARVSLEVKARPAVVLVVDVSGSMSGDKLAAAKRALEAFAAEAIDRVDVGIVAFSDHVVDALPPTGNLTEVVETIERLRAGGGTVYSAALHAAYSMLLPYAEVEVPASIVFASDGMPGDPPTQYMPIVEQLGRLGVRVHCIAIKANIAVLASIASKTGGRVFQVNNLDELVNLYKKLAVEEEKRLTGEAETRAKTTVTLEKPLAPLLYATAAALAGAAAYTRARTNKTTI